jgi:hypothetical protein
MKKSDELGETHAVGIVIKPVPKFKVGPNACGVDCSRLGLSVTLVSCANVGGAAHIITAARAQQATTVVRMSPPAPGERKVT